MGEAARGVRLGQRSGRGGAAGDAPGPRQGGLQDGEVAADAHDPHDGAAGIVKEEQLARGQPGVAELAAEDLQLGAEEAEAERCDHRHAWRSGAGARELGGGGVDAGIAEVEQAGDPGVDGDPLEIADRVLAFGACLFGHVLGGLDDRTCRLGQGRRQVCRPRIGGRAAAGDEREDQGASQEQGRPAGRARATAHGGGH
ncbi:hypothetical protein [Nannocystis pusilla]|uniref:hypothetical protein n=1 Tax=Nannocystis pusilla TaxID=889268 RepID=UPI003B814ED9